MMVVSRLTSASAACSLSRNTSQSSRMKDANTAAWSHAAFTCAISSARVTNCCSSSLTTTVNCCRQGRSEEHTSELQSHSDLVCRLLLEKKKKIIKLNINLSSRT